MKRFIFLAAIASYFASSLHAQVVPNVFDRTSGLNVYYTNGIGEHLADTNWTPFFAGVFPNSGSEFLASGNGNANHDFVNIGLAKSLGGTVQNHPYTVSFFIASYSDRTDINLQPVQISDFSTLRIGGNTGTMLWTSTPTPTIRNHWYQWTGVYTPSLADVGGQFTFKAIFTLPSLSTIAIDGPIEVPEPTALLLALIAIGGGWLARRYKKPVS
jgi:hypothetical protein